MTGNWKFDKSVADNFDAIADANIPNYASVIQKCVTVANKSFDTDAKIADIGCATGKTLSVFNDSGYTNLSGVDTASCMLKKCGERLPNATLIDSSKYPSTFNNMDLVMANWTLHFITNLVDRVTYINDVYNSLSADGLFILSEKVEHSDLALELYHDYKRQHGMTEDDITEKCDAIKGVLVPVPLSFYIRVLHDAGFNTVEIIDADFCFVTILAQK